jgi:hypothetical protein
VPSSSKAIRVIEKLHCFRLTKAAELAEAGVGETLTYYKRFFVNRDFVEIALLHSFVRTRLHSSVAAADYAAAGCRDGQGLAHLRANRARWHADAAETCGAPGIYGPGRLWLCGAGDLVAKRDASAASVTRLPCHVLPS